MVTQPTYEYLTNYSRISFNITLFITGAFALAAGGSPNYVVLSLLVTLWSVGVGGNLPVDSAIFLGSFLAQTFRLTIE
jgi:hypothetical protein